MMGTSGSSTKNIGGYFRRAHHAGSWYSDSPKELDTMLSSFLENAQIELNTAATTATATTTTTTTTTTAIPRSVVVPHAGYSYSGKAAAFSYLALKEAVQLGEIETIVVLHPSHHVRLNGCAISGKYIILILTCSLNAFLYYKYSVCFCY